MPGMSPRIKAKKGRFGVGGFDPTINITSHVTGDSEALTIDFVMNAVATDPEDGDISAGITWNATQITGGTSGIVSFTSGTGGTQTVKVTVEAGDYDIIATGTDGTNIVTDTVRITVV